MAQKAPACGAVCPLVWAAVPAAASQVGMVAQPMQMGMMIAPMAAPVMMPLLDAPHGSAYFGATPTNFTDAQYAWPIEASAWPMYFDRSYMGEEAPQQLPMEAIAPQESPVERACDFSAQIHVEQAEVEVPAQVKMDSALQQPETTVDAQRNTAATSSARTLRRRRGQECSTNSSYGMVADLPSVDEQPADQEGGVDAETAQAQELANSLLVQMQAGGNEQWAAVASFERLAFTSKVSSLAAQTMLEKASKNDKVALAAGLRGHVRSAVQSKHANHVVQKITEVMPVAHASFIVDELKGTAYDVVRHVFGCRVMLRILEHLSASDLSTIELVEEIFVNIEDLCTHPYGSFVARHLLEFGLPQHRQRVVNALRTDLAGYTKHKFGSHVVEAALRHACFSDQQVLARELLGDKDQLMSLSGNQFGRHVVRALVSMPDSLKKEALAVLQPMEDKLKASRYGKSVFQEVRKATSA